METMPPPIGLEPQKKSMSPWAWAGIGCGGLVLVGLVAGVLLVGKCVHEVKNTVKNMSKNPHKAAAEMMVKSNHDLSLVSENDNTGEITFRSKSTGEQTTISYRDMAAGRITMKDGSGKEVQIGSADLSKVPAWVPRYKGLSEANGTFHQETPEKVEGLFTGSTTDSPDEVEAFYKAQAEKLGLNSRNQNSFSMNGNVTRSASYSGGGKELNVVLTGESGQPLRVNVSYSQEKK
jgi:hypothetical protein